VNPRELKLPEQLSGQAACQDDCLTDRCRPGCSLQLMGELLATPGAVTSEEADYLLDLHQLLSRRADAEQALRVFCELRRRLEQRHYLALYRLRRWLQNHILAEVQPSEDAAPIWVPLLLKCYCLEAVRRVCLCSALQAGLSFDRPRLRFRFVPLPEFSAVEASLADLPAATA
jgi:hypothetical protein